MKKLLIVILLGLGVAQAGSIIVPKLKSPKDEIPTNSSLPQVIINGTSTGFRGYSASFGVEYTVCPREYQNQIPPRTEEFDRIADGATVFVKHCTKCNTGVYSELKDESEFVNNIPVKRCTFCGDKEVIR